LEWWHNREENDLAWKVNIKDLHNWNLDIKNPKSETINVTYSVKEVIENLKSSINTSNEIISELEKML
jgi:type I restriction enzyme M protein